MHTTHPPDISHPARPPPPQARPCLCPCPPSLAHPPLPTLPRPTTSENPTPLNVEVFKPKPQVQNPTAGVPLQGRLAVTTEGGAAGSGSGFRCKGSKNSIVDDHLTSILTIPPPLALEKIPVNPHRHQAAGIVHFGAVHAVAYRINLQRLVQRMAQRHQMGFA